MREREPRKETIAKGDLFFLWHPGSPDTFSGYGLAQYPGTNEVLTGLLMIDRPAPATPEWLQEVQTTFGPFHLVPMTVTEERGIFCQMEIVPESRAHLHRFPRERTTAIQHALQPLLDHPPRPVFDLRWDEETQVWDHTFIPLDALPREIRDVEAGMRTKCQTVETDTGVIHQCSAPDADIAGFADKPIHCRWDLVETQNGDKQPRTPLIRLEILVHDVPLMPYQFEAFYDVAQEEHARVLARLAYQKHLYLDFCGEDGNHRFTQLVPHDEQQWQYLDELVAQALEH